MERNHQNTDSPAALIGEMYAAAERTASPLTRGGDGKATEYGQLLLDQFQTIADQFCSSEGRTAEDALAFSSASRRMLKAYARSAESGNVDRDTLVYALVYALGLVDRLHECLTRLVNDGLPTEQ